MTINTDNLCRRKFEKFVTENPLIAEANGIGWASRQLGIWGKQSVWLSEMHDYLMVIKKCLGAEIPPYVLQLIEMADAAIALQHAKDKP